MNCEVGALLDIILNENLAIESFEIICKVSLEPILIDRWTAVVIEFTYDDRNA
jgi:hypothetical protein